MNIYYIKDSARSHKLLPLLNGLNVINSLCIPSFFRLFQEERGIVLVDSFGKKGLSGVLLSLLLRWRLVIRLRGDFVLEAQEVYLISPSVLARIRAYINEKIAALCICQSSLVVVNSIYLQNRFISYYPDKPTAVVYNPYTEIPRGDDKFINLPSQGLHLLSITNFNLRSKVFPLLNAIKYWVPEDFWTKFDLHWVICGSGSLSEYFSKEIDQLPFSKRIHFLGYVNNISSLMEWASIFVHLSLLDAFPNVILEAMIHEKPIIVNYDSCGALEQVRNNINGFIVSGPIQFVSALAKLADDPQLTYEFGISGKAIVEEEFSVNTQSLKLKNTLINLVGGKYE